MYPQAQLVVWLDYSQSVVLWRAVCRSVQRTFSAPEPGENAWWRLRQWVSPGGPLFACRVYAARKREFSELEQRSRVTAPVLRFTAPAAARAWLASLGHPDQSHC